MPRRARTHLSDKLARVKPLAVIVVQCTKQHLCNLSSISPVKWMRQAPSAAKSAHCRNLPKWVSSEGIRILIFSRKNRKPGKRWRVAGLPGKANGCRPRLSPPSWPALECFYCFAWLLFPTPCRYACAQLLQVRCTGPYRAATWAQLAGPGPSVLQCDCWVAR